MALQGVSHWMQACVVLQLSLSVILTTAAPETSRNYYNILNVEPTASDSQIRKAFRRLAVKYHPDKNKSTDAEKTFREIAEAYKVLSDKEQRRQYDSVGHAVFLNRDKTSLNPEDQPETGFHFSFADFFHHFDESILMEEEVFHWSFKEEGGGAYEHYSFQEPGFSFLFHDSDEYEDY
ncbi:dnaJ homolog subfamily B member 9-like [Cheilinus undulatus]|uniref:dnaJ homolog subfamily B member 9-like n=1 Tax=Cheilinus undulatus TaxID=241271 RepID=UPI001BD5CDB5|nr:dnaJ homolog subfamily B member 9-like [Cheilinus undulatus]